MQVKRKMSGGKSAHSFYPAPGIYHLRSTIYFPCSHPAPPASYALRVKYNSRATARLLLPSVLPARFGGSRMSVALTLRYFVPFPALFLLAIIQTISASSEAPDTVP